MTPDEFKKEMEGYVSSDPEAAHELMDHLLCEVLTKLGYGEGVEIFEEQEKYYH